MPTIRRRGGGRSEVTELGGLGAAAVKPGAAVAVDDDVAV